MELRQLEYVVAVADHGGFTRAAAALRVSQPSLSHGVRAVEDELGLELFARLGRAVQLTAAGEEVVDSARRVLQDVAELYATAAAVAGNERGTLAITAIPTLAVDPLAGLVGRFRRAHPGVTVRVHEAETVDAVRDQVASGRAELGLADLGSAQRGLARVELYRQEVVAVCPPRTQIGGDHLTPGALATMPLVATPPGTSTRVLLDRATANVGATPNVVVEINQREAILPLVLAGAGTALLPGPLAQEAARRGAVVVPLRPAVTRRIGLLHRTGRLSPAAAAMVDLAHSTAARGARPPRGER
jgi:DNA-binding transcriptional LysR family regulator